MVQYLHSQLLNSGHPGTGESSEFRFNIYGVIITILVFIGLVSWISVIQYILCKNKCNTDIFNVDKKIEYYDKDNNFNTNKFILDLDIDVINYGDTSDLNLWQLILFCIIIDVIIIILIILIIKNYHWFVITYHDA